MFSKNKTEASKGCEMIELFYIILAYSIVF